MNQESRKAGKNLRDSKLTQEIIACAMRTYTEHLVLVSWNLSDEEALGC